MALWKVFHSINGEVTFYWKFLCCISLFRVELILNKWVVTASIANSVSGISSKKNLISCHSTLHWSLPMSANELPFALTQAISRNRAIKHLISVCFGRARTMLQKGAWNCPNCFNRHQLEPKFSFNVVQSVPSKTSKTVYMLSFIDWYALSIVERKEELQKLSDIVVANAFFSKITFVRPLMKNGFHVIFKLREDANL